jgi:GxxExxY protein
MNHEAHKAHQGLAENLEKAASSIVDAGLKVHRALGPGLLETAYEHCLAYELQKRGYRVRRQVVLPIRYDDTELDAGYRLDLLIDEQVIVEVKSVDALARVHESQVMTYLKLSGHRLGFLINFNVPMFRQGVKRIVL